MKNRKFIYFKTALFSVLLFAGTVSCEREISDEVEFAIASTNPDIFIDGFSGGLDYYPYAGSYADAFSVDEDTKYSGTSSMRFDVPSFGNPEGPYSGAAFIVGDVEANTGGRNLTDYDALTFYAKATQAATLDNVGFGQDFNNNEFQVTLQNVAISTNWVKYIIPIPNAYKLTLEKGMFWYSEGPEDSKGYTFWIDDLKFEKLGTIAQPQPAIFNGEDTVQQVFIGSTSTMNGLTQTFNLANGENLTVTAAPSYYTFNSTDVDVARVSELGVISVVGQGNAKITATLGSVGAAGSLSIESLGTFTPAPTPTYNASNVISIFSDAYTNQPVDYYNGYWAPYQTTQGQDDIDLGGDKIISYSALNFVGIQFAVDVATIDASQMTHFHIDIQVQNPMESGDFLTLTLQDIGADDAFDTGNEVAGSITYNNSTLSNGNWVSLDIPLSSFSGLTSRANLAQIVFVSDATVTDVLLDNIYFHN